MEDLAVNREFWRSKRVLVTGHTGFKGSWLCLWLEQLGAEVTGLALPPPASQCLFSLASVGEQMNSIFADIRDLEAVQKVITRQRPQIVFHLAAQPLVRKSYAQPVDTYQVNVMGTVHLLEAIRAVSDCRVLVNVTSDKCYENKEWVWGYREDDPLGGHDPYSSSKACSELVTAAYRSSFFGGRGIASARAGNVIGGGDFSKDRIIPDFLAAVAQHKPLYVRHPHAVRPWQHVLESLSGYVLLAEKLWHHPYEYSQGWNFGPSPDDVRSVQWIVEKLNSHFGGRISWQVDTGSKPHEANMLMLDSAKARTLLDWKPRWSLEQALYAVTQWHNAYESGQPVRDIAIQQIDAYASATSGNNNAMITPA